MKDSRTMTTIVLAAGEGKRMYSKTPKVLHKVCGKSMLEHVMDCAREAAGSEPVVVIGHGAEKVREMLPFISYVVQEEQLGTGHAVMQADSYIVDGDVLILCGDTPLLRADTIKKMIAKHRENGNSATVLTAIMEDSFGYGRIVRSNSMDGIVEAIVEEKDATEEQKKLKEINSGILIFDGKELESALKELGNENAQGEYYLTDVISIFRKRGHLIGGFIAEDNNEIMGVNNKAQLSDAEMIMNERIVREHMLNGVIIKKPNDVYIEADVKIGRDAIIMPGCYLEGKTVIGEDCIIGPNSKLNNVIVDNGAKIEYSVVSDSSIGEGTTVGPFAYMRPGNTVGKHCKVGDFVEMKNSTFGDNTKASHLAYIGDGDIGSNVNLGCGIIFVNYDGVKKYRSTIGDGAFVGCNSNLISPVKVGAGAYVAAGTTITRDVPDGSMAIGRVRQELKSDYARKFKKTVK